MRSFFALLLLSFTGHAWANDSVCVIAQIENGTPKYFQQKVIDFNAPTLLETTNGLFSGKVLVQHEDVEDTGLSIMLIYKDVKTGGFFDLNSKTPVVYLFADGKQAQINCWLR